MSQALTEAELADPDERRGGTGWGRFLAGKLGGAAASLLLVVALGFLLFRMIPGDPVATLTKDKANSAQQMAQLRERLGLDKPMIQQFLDYLFGIFRGDLGVSYGYNRPVADLIAERFWPTLLLVGTATVLAVALGLWLGVRAAWKRGSGFDRTQTGIALTLWSVPQFWLGLLLLIATHGLFPSGGMRSPDTPPDFLSQAGDVAYHLVLPCVTLLAVIYAQYMLVMRSSLLGEMDAEYLTTARAKGLREDLVRRRHAVPNALLPTVTLVFLQFGLVVSGTVTVETVFSWPGLGLLTYEALRVPDLPLLQGVFVVLAGSVIVMNLIAEVLYRVLDPRVRAR
ncbi:ABC transporter permease [Amycolatopsis acidicola]|uniref:ABC transporter permease n=1 Tax=Amycolatopsis acidicola TaxID=2596893 RepID=A0A5N0VNT9_9PSEU|nr:ABC transporter permease [Amycolatopsis acidicola]KAA9166291.1 ABC transporter permease [Amycolatopsis acidicola]